MSKHVCPSNQWTAIGSATTVPTLFTAHDPVYVTTESTSGRPLDDGLPLEAGFSIVVPVGLTISANPLLSGAAQAIVHRMPFGV